MRILLILLAVCLSGCATSLTTASPEVNTELMQPCTGNIAEPLTTADQNDLARALNQAITFGEQCAERIQKLIDAVQLREQMAKAIKEKIEK